MYVHCGTVPYPRLSAPGKSTQVVQWSVHELALLIVTHFCSARIQQTIKRVTAGPLPANDIRTISILIVIIALLGEHCDFERVRRDCAGVSYMLLHRLSFSLCRSCCVRS